MRTAKELLDFNRFNAEASARRAPQPIGISQQNRLSLEEIIRNHSDRRHELPNREDLRQVYRLFITAHGTRRLRTEFDTLSRARKLAWALIYSENQQPFDRRIVDNRLQLGNALQLIENRFCISALLGVFDALLQAWDAQNAWRLRKFVKRHLTDYEGRRTFVQRLRANMRWYCEENSATQLAMKLLRSRVKLSDAWSYLELPDYMHSYSYFGAVATAYIALNHRAAPETVADVIEFVEKHNNDKTARSILSKLIERLGFEASEHLRQPLQSYALREWGDPRLTGGDVRWRAVSDEAKQIFTRWITKEDLRFFFDVVARACDDQKFAYRRAFWLAYLEHISLCRPMLRRDAEYLFRNDPQALQYYRERRPAILTGGNSSQHAFIIQIDNYTFVEFSTAAACYVYNNANLPFRLSDSEYHITELRDQPRADHRVIHRNSENYSWQRDLASWLRSNLGIEPVRSY